MKIMSKLKVFYVTYRCEVKRTATVEAKSESDARKKFDEGDFEEGYDIDCHDLDDVCITEEDF